VGAFRDKDFTVVPLHISDLSGKKARYLVKVAVNYIN
jgi:hypothetical protein